VGTEQERPINLSLPTLRLAHFSDVHVSVTGCAWRREDWLNKRLAAWANLRLLGRGFRFRRAEAVLSALAADLRGRAIDHVIFSGDATALGFEEEMTRAAHLLGLDEPDPMPGLAVPGNHDYCTATAARSGLFERHFAAWQQGERVGGETYPFAQRVGPVWLIGVNSSTANRWAWDASGDLGAEQLARLETLLARLEGEGPRILVTHYPVALASGKPERSTHGLRNLETVVKVAERGGISLWLHGHRHGSYFHARTDLAPFPVVCAGSATQSGKWWYNEYALRGNQLEGLRRVYDSKRGRFQDGESFELSMGCKIPLA
jgi:3',5'-cyclic AMP phosphodiesterase CpdA